MPDNFFHRNQRAWLRTGRENKEPTPQNELSVHAGCIVILKTKDSCIRVLLLDTKRFQNFLDRQEMSCPGFFVVDIRGSLGGLLKGKYVGNRMTLNSTQVPFLTTIPKVKAQIYKIIPSPEKNLKTATLGH